MDKIEKLVSVRDLISDRSPVADLKSYIKAHTFDRSKVPEDDDTILFLQDIPIGSKQNIVSITGRSKSRKTVFASAVATSMFLTDASHLGFSSTLAPDAHILHIDTEQGYKHYYKSVIRIFDDANLQSTPERFTSIHTRDSEIPFRKEVIEYLVKTLKPAVLIIDGVTDLVYDINSQEEATKLGELLLRWGTEYNMLIVAIIHTTKTTGFMTGAVGTVLEKKSETVILVELDKDDPMTSHVKCQYSRNAPFYSFSIRADDEGKYSIVSESEMSNRGKGGNHEPLSYEDLLHEDVINRSLGVGKKTPKDKMPKAVIQAVKASWNGTKISPSEAKKFIQFWKDRTWILIDTENNYVAGTPVIKPENGQAQMVIMGPDDNLPF